MTQAQVRFIDTMSYKQHGLVLIDREGGAWFTFSKPWTAILWWFWWWLQPATAVKKVVQLRKADGVFVRVRVVQLSTTHTRLSGKP